MTEEIRKILLLAQKKEMTEYHIYNKLAAVTKDQNNADVLRLIAQEELIHAKFFEKLTGVVAVPNRILVWCYFLIARILGLTFGIKLMEKGESQSSSKYKKLEAEYPEIAKITSDEEKHELALISMINEEKLEYAGSIVLGLNDALVELTGTLAGLTLAFANTRMIALSGLITGIAASMSMAASSYLYAKTEGSKNALKSSIYTGIAYISTVLFLVLPYLILDDYRISLAVMMVLAVLVILCFNFYISVAKDLNFKHRFIEMTTISLSVAVISFLIGFVLNFFMGAS